MPAFAGHTGPQKLYPCHMPRVVSGSACLYATWSWVQNGSGRPLAQQRQSSGMTTPAIEECPGDDETPAADAQPRAARVDVADALARWHALSPPLPVPKPCPRSRES